MKQRKRPFHWTRLSLFILCLVQLFGCSSQQKLNSPILPIGMLPDDVVPKQYNVELQLDPNAKHIPGRVQIDIDVKLRTNHFYMHAKDILLQQVELIAQPEVRLLTTRPVHDSGLIRLDVDGWLEPGTYRLDIIYEAKVDEGLDGIYQVNQNDKHYLVSQMQPVSARKVIPSFDEPRFKTRFKLKIKAPKGDTVVTNAPVNNVQEQGKWSIHDFQQTEPLPTYLLAFVVGPFDVLEYDAIPATRVRPNSIPLRGITAKGRKTEIDYALKRTADLVLAMENYFGTPYPYKKLDVIAAPDFAAGAMENVGAIIYREPLILLNENSSDVIKHDFLAVHAHELAHQWFGNWVTPFWWNDLWLNESFATWLSYKIAKKVEPNYPAQMANLTLKRRAMQQDQLPSARVIRNPINDIHDISNAFDRITYDKGASIINMVESWIGEDQFKKGIQHYMNQNGGGVTTADNFIVDLTRPLKLSKRLEVNGILTDFLNQPGIPSLEIDTLCNSNRAYLRLKQDKYQALGTFNHWDANWRFPVCVQVEVSGGKRYEHCEWMQRDEQLSGLPNAECPVGIHPDPSLSGYYVWRLSKEYQDRLIKNLSQLSPEQALAVVDNQILAYKAGKLSLDELAKVFEGALNRQDAAVLPLSSVMSQLHDDWLTSSQWEALSKRLHDDWLSLYKKTGYQTKNGKGSPVESYIQSNVLETLLFDFKDEGVRQSLKPITIELVNFPGTPSWKVGKGEIPEHLYTSLLRLGVELEGSKYAQHLIHLLDKTTEAHKRNAIVSAVSRSKDGQLLRKWVDSAIKLEHVRKNERYVVFRSMFDDVQTREEAWVYLTNRLTDWKDAIGEHSGWLTRSVAAFCRPTIEQEARNLFEPHLATMIGGERNFGLALEQVAHCLSVKDYSLKQNLVEDPQGYVDLSF